MSATEQESRPMRAEIYAVYGGQTRAHIVIFGKYIKKVFNGNGHNTAAREWVKEWDDHLSREWLTTRATAVNLMEEFTARLRSCGVQQDTITAAMVMMSLHA